MAKFLLLLVVLYCLLWVPAILKKKALKERLFLGLAIFLPFLFALGAIVVLRL